MSEVINNKEITDQFVGYFKARDLIFKSRHMFGAYGVFFEGVMIGLIASGFLYLKSSPITKPLYQDRQWSTYVQATRWAAEFLDYFQVPVFLPGQEEMVEPFVLEAIESKEVETKKQLSLHELPNMSRKFVRPQMKAGIDTVDALIELGAPKAYMKFMPFYPDNITPVTVLWKLQGAITGRYWTVLSKKEQVKLLSEVEGLGDFIQQPSFYLYLSQQKQAIAMQIIKAEENYS
ncbi:TfoX/Sxy family DNA transformation protein [Vibrio vulnificus]